jgi:hypothetical protein
VGGRLIKLEAISVPLSRELHDHATEEPGPQDVTRGGRGEGVIMYSEDPGQVTGGGGGGGKNCRAL